MTLADVGMALSQSLAIWPRRLAWDGTTKHLTIFWGEKKKKKKPYSYFSKIVC
jgi:hypothetical protein